MISAEEESIVSVVVVDVVDEECEKKPKSCGIVNCFAFCVMLRIVVREISVGRASGETWKVFGM